MARSCRLTGGWLIGVEARPQPADRPTAGRTFGQSPAAWSASGDAAPESVPDAVRLVRPDGDLYPVPGPELGHQARDVGLDGAEADVQLVGYLAVGQPTCDGDERLLLAVGERID